MKTLRSPKGFTLVELAIVMVIIGIILGAVLKGQELIENAKIKRLYNQYREILAAIYTYYDKYTKFPGDDNLAASRWENAVNGNNNGAIDGGIVGNCSGQEASTQESCNLWSHLRRANLITGAGGDRTNPQHSYGGPIVVAYTTVNGISQNWIVFINVPAQVAWNLDLQYDDGGYNTGSVQAAGGTYTSTSLLYVYFKL